MAIFKRGLEQIVPNDALDKIMSAKTPLLIKFGADPSAPDLHLGHCVVLKKLRLLQDMGHIVQFVIGDFTARIGDPTGKSETRKPLSEDDVKNNAASYKEQVFKLLDESKTEVVYNASWLGALTSTEMISLTARYTVARMLERDDFSKRFKSNQSIGVHEFLYPLLQGYDSVVLKSDVEMGGTDQTFNLLMGRHLQRDYGCEKEQSIITLPILEGLDGVQKMSKSLNNHIGIMDSPKDIFGKTMSLPDDKITRYFSLLTDVSDMEIETMALKMSRDGLNPRDFKIDLAKRLVCMFYTQDDADEAEEEFKRVFAKGLIPDDIREVVVSHASVVLLQVLIEEDLVSSKKEGQRLMQSGAVTVDGEKILDFRYELFMEESHILKVGKRKFLKVVKG
jgi:tyrosyl-tRNA synthetase